MHSDKFDDRKPAGLAHTATLQKNKQTLHYPCEVSTCPLCLHINSLGKGGAGTEEAKK